MAALQLAEWDHALFSELQHLLARVVGQPTTSTLRRLHQKLEEARPWLVHLTNVPGPSERDKQQVQQGPSRTPSGASVQISGETLNLVNLISNELSISQLLAATLILQAEEERPRYPSRSTPEIAIFTYHAWTTQMLDFLRELLRVTITIGTDLSRPFDELRNWVEEMLSTRVSLGADKGEGTLVDQIIIQLDAISQRIATLLGSRASGIQYEIQSFRVAALRSEQCKMAGILANIAEAGMLGRGQVVKVIKWLRKAERTDSIVETLLASLFAALQPIDRLQNGDNDDSDDSRYEVMESWIQDVRFLRLVGNLVVHEEWRIPQLRDAAKLCFCLFYLAALRHNADVANAGIDAPLAEHYISETVAGDVLKLLRMILFSMRVERGQEIPEVEQPVQEDALVKLATRSDPANDEIIVRHIHDLVFSVATKKNFVRNLRLREDDVSIRRSQAAAPAPHYQDFLALMAMVYRSLSPDSAVRIWSNECSNFTNVLLDTRGQLPTPALCELLSAISTGPACASASFERLKESRMPWTALFKFYQHYFDIMPHLFEPMKAGRNANSDPMSQEEVDICIGWTKLLSTVVRFSPLARGALMQSKPHPLQYLFDMINCDVPVEVKAAALDAITAFCRRSGDSADEDIRHRAVEHFERVSFADPTLDTRFIDPARLPPPIGWIAKMEYSEVEIQTYPLTRAYVHFLTTLVPEPSISGEPSKRPTRPNNVLRRGIHYVIDRVLLVPNARRYAREAEKWEMLDAIVALLEKAVLAFDMSDLVTQVDHRSIGAIATSLSEEPGFTALLRLLSEQQIFAVLAGLLDNAVSDLPPRPAFISRPLRRVLRLYHRILDVQLVFSDVLLLTLSDPARNATHPFRRPLGLQSLDQYLLNHLSNVNAIALLVGDDDLATSLCSVKIIQQLAQSSVFSRNDIFRGEYSSSVNRLAGIIDASDDSIRIAQGFCIRLDGDGDALPASEIRNVERKALLGADEALDSSDSLPIVIRSAIMDLLVDGTQLDATGPTIAHFLLGFDFKAGDFGLQDPRLPDSRLSCLHIILRQLSDGDGSLAETRPRLASSTARLVHQLFSNPVTGKTTMSYAASISDFSARQLSELPRHCPTVDDQEGLGIVTSRTGEVITTSEVAVAFLDFQRWIVSAVSLDVFAFQGSGTSATEIAELVFHGVEDAEEGPNGPAGIRPALIVDLLNNVDLAWREETDPAASSRSLDFFAGFDFDQFKRADVDWWDVDALGETMRSYRRHLERQGKLVNPDSAKAMDAEIQFVIHRLSQKNRETDISLAKGAFLAAWNSALKVSLGMLFKHIPEEQQEVVLFELLDAVLDRLTGDLASGVLEILCESVLVVMTALINMLGEFEGINLPVDRLSGALQGVLEAVTRPGTTENARGNLYASIGQYLSLVSTSIDAVDDGASAAGSIVTSGTVLPGQPLSLHRASLTVIGAKKDRLFATLCRDAMDDRDVWKTECFSLLGALVGLCTTERDRQAISPLSQGGYLPLFVRSIKDREIALQECLSPDPVNLHAFWVYESKITFLNAIAATRKGAEDLLDAGIFESLAMCGFLAVQTISEDTLANAVVADVVLRQHRVLMYALQLVVRVLSSLSKGARGGAGHGIRLLHAHRDALLVLLRENQMAITIIGIEEIRLIVSILAAVVHKVPEDDLRSPTGFGAFHLALLSIAARFFDHDAWTSALINPEEKLEAEADVLALNHSLLVYLCNTTSGLKTGKGAPVLVTGAQRSTDTSIKYIASAPSLQMVIDLLADLTEDLAEVGNDYEVVLERLSNGQAIDRADLQHLNSGVLTNEVEGDAAMAAFVQRGQMLFNMIESILLLVWRHLLFYANDARGANQPVRPGDLAASLGAFSGSQLDASRSKAGTIRVLERVAGGLRGTLERLDDVQVHPDLQRRSEKGGAYHGMLIRRVRELISGLTGDMPEQ